VDAFGRRSTTATNGTDGTGVDIYGIGKCFVFAENKLLIKDADTGIYIEHNDFGGRASWGATFGGYGDVDDNGHGTHTASTAVGAQYGIAKAATVVAVKVLGANGNGAYSDIIAGIEWVMNAASKSGKPSIANMSLGGSASESMDQAVKNAIAAGVHFAVAAGNAAMDADGTSPARGEDLYLIRGITLTLRTSSSCQYRWRCRQSK
jgi:subtilisin family serine protease